MSNFAAESDVDTSDEETTLAELEKMQMQMENSPRGMFVSGWEDPDSNIGIEEDKTPHETLEREILFASDEGYDIDRVREILVKDPSCVNAVDRDGYTPLHRAAYNNKYELAQVLLQHGANVHAQTEYKWTPLHSASKWNNARLAALLLQHGSDVNALSDGDQTALHVAATVSNCRNTAVTLLFHPRINADLQNNSNEKADFIAKRTGPSLPIFRMGHKSLQVETGIID